MGTVIFNKLANFCSKDDFITGMNGVYFENGWEIATNGSALAAVKGDYPSELEGKILSKKIGFIDGRFPSWKLVIPSDNENDIKIKINISSLERAVKRYRDAKKKDKNVSSLFCIKFGDTWEDRVIFYYDSIKLIINAMKIANFDTLIMRERNSRYDSAPCLRCITDEYKFLFMPCYYDTDFNLNDIEGQIIEAIKL